jgi:hypothetical protein
MRFRLLPAKLMEQGKQQAVQFLPQELAPMKTLLPIFFLMATGTAALAQSAGSTQGMSCHQAAALVRSRGAVVLHTGPMTYDRFVSGAGFCLRGETTEPVWVRTADTAQCFIGYRCRQADLDFGQ